MIPLIDGTIQAGFETASKLLQLLDNHLPGQQQMYEAWKEKHPLRAERQEKKILKIKLRKLRELHRFAVSNGVEPDVLIKYTNGDTTTIQVLTQMKNHD